MRASILHKALLACALAALAWACGCASRSVSTAATAEDDQVKPTEKLIPDPDLLLADVPVPLGASFKTDSSATYKTGNRRIATHLYGIWAKRSLVRLFYLENMPAHGWKLTNTSNLTRAYRLNFTKADESCRLTIGPTNWYFQNLIEIVVQPVDNPATASSERRIK